MVDKSDLERVNRLFEEWRLIQLAVENFDAGGVITSMTVSGQSLDQILQPPPPGPFMGPPRMSISVPTASITYPPQMVDGIKQQFAARQATISQELSDLGVTGTDTPAASPTAAPPPPRSPASPTASGRPR